LHISETLQYNIVNLSLVGSPIHSIEQHHFRWQWVSIKGHSINADLCFCVCIANVVAFGGIKSRVQSLDNIIRKLRYITLDVILVNCR